MKKFLLLFVVMVLFIGIPIMADSGPPGEAFTVESVVLPTAEAAVEDNIIIQSHEIAATVSAAQMEADLIEYAVPVEKNFNPEVNVGMVIYRETDFKIERRFEHPAFIGIV